MTTSVVPASALKRCEELEGENKRIPIERWGRLTAEAKLAELVEAVERHQATKYWDDRSMKEPDDLALYETVARMTGMSGVQPWRIRLTPDERDLLLRSLSYYRDYLAGDSPSLGTLIDRLWALPELSTPDRLVEGK